MKVCKDCAVELTEENRYGGLLLCKDDGKRRERERARDRQLNKRKYYMQKMWCNLRSRATKESLGSNAYGKPYISFEEFYEWYENESKQVFELMFQTFKDAGCDQRLAPTVDRIDSSRGYERDNIQWLTLSENASKGDR